MPSVSLIDGHIDPDKKEMTTQEVIRFLKETISICHTIRDRELNAVCVLSISALEKQIPKKPYEETIATEDGYMTKKRSFFYCCPNCFNHLNENQKHCDDCGQALDWSDTE